VTQIQGQFLGNLFEAGYNENNCDISQVTAELTGYFYLFLPEGIHIPFFAQTKGLQTYKRKHSSSFT
jgi:hypothetical protein